MSDELVAELAREAVATAAPQELPLFRAASRRYFEDPDGATRGTRGGDEVLGFGIEGAAILITPVALNIAKDVIRFLVDEITRTAKDEARPAIEGRVRRLFRRGREAEPEPEEAPDALSDDQLGEVRRIALEKASLLQLPREQAELLADAMVGSLATAH
jgi:transglutaminase-like putative cysteine protease